MSFLGQSPGGHAIGESCHQPIFDSIEELFWSFPLTHFSPLPTSDVYQCTGNVERDVPELCALLGIKDVPLFNIKRPSPPVLDEESGEQAS